MTLIKTTQHLESLKDRVSTLIQEVNSTHRYSMNRIYGLYNEVFSVAETPQSCASCLIRKINQLKFWLADQSNNNLLSSEIQTRNKKGRKRSNHN